ncbi:MAG: DNA mismatch repair protein MutS [Taibaiella sp.]|nr:DNA mismatch repair protein MutS [Taibaiella sp.]
MQNDKTTLNDLSIFTADGGGVFALLDHTTTQQGRDVLRQYIYNPPDSYERLQQMQDVIKYWEQHIDKWPSAVSNGTLVMLVKFFEGADNITAPPSGMMRVFSSFLQKALNKNEFFFTQFSISHLSDFLNGCMHLSALLSDTTLPALLKQELEFLQDELKQRLTAEVIKINTDTPFAGLATISYKARREMKSMVYRLMHHYARLDAWRSMAIATKYNKWTYPELIPGKPLVLDAEGLYHPLLTKPVAYSINFSNKKNFLLLTGANMSGKTTFMRALGVGVLLAHLGMGVPAARLRITFLQGIITNMQVEDNLMRGESYFFAEVQRMKVTAEKLLQSEGHLVLMDELFKGTNVHDAYECTRAVVEGLLNRPDQVMILSTHLYEVAQHFKDRSDILFAYFVTRMHEDDSYDFAYELKTGISDDRIGYRILQKEGVIDLLHRNTVK